MDNENIKEILDELKRSVNEDDWFEIDEINGKRLLDYITNLQEKTNNQTEEINRLVKQREKFMKKYGYLKEENERLKQLCDEYEEEHSTEFKIWKDERHQLLDYKLRNEKAIEYIKQNSKCGGSFIDNKFVIEYIDEIFNGMELLNILNGDDE